MIERVLRMYKNIDITTTDTRFRYTEYIRRSRYDVSGLVSSF
jgi:hypothetical protein